MKKEHVVQVFSDYISKENPGYALYINSKWGSGKTHLWNHDLKPLAEESGLKPIYISLNGIADLGEVQGQLLLNMVTNNRKAKNIAFFIRNSSNFLSKFFLKSPVTDLFRGLKYNHSKLVKYIICIDDVERSGMAITEVLGWVNSMVEHSQGKVLLLANEEAPEFEADAFRVIKEKAIGWELHYEPNLEEILTTMFEDIFAIEEGWKPEHFDFINSIIKQYQEVNIRTIRFYLGVVRKSEIWKYNLPALTVRNFLFFTFCITREYKAGNLTIGQASTQALLNIFSKGALYINADDKMMPLLGGIKEEGENNPKLKTAKTLRDKYYKPISNVEPFFAKSIWDFILTGYWDSDGFQREIGKLKKELPPLEKAYEDIIGHDFRFLSNAEFEQSLTDLISYCKEGKYSIYQYSTISDSLLSHQKRGLLSLSPREIKDLLINGIDMAKGHTEPDQHELDNTLHFRSGFPQTMEVREAIKRAHNELMSDTYADQIYQALHNLTELVLNKYEPFKNITIPLFKYMDTNEWIRRIGAQPNMYALPFLKIDKIRYASSNIYEFLSEEESALRELAEGLEKEHLDKHSGLQRANLEEIISLVKRWADKVKEPSQIDT